MTPREFWCIFIFEMPGRILPLVNDQIYHVFNRGIDHRPTFTTKWELHRAMLILSYYRFSTPPMRLSRFLMLSNEDREKILTGLNQEGKKLVELLCFCLMPNHFHFLIKQTGETGISKYISLLQNSFTRYFNIRNERIGPLFLDQFKAKLIETDEQLIHVSRYIHLNPLTSYVVKDFDTLKNYPWSSFPQYLGNSNEGVCSTKLILDFFKSKGSYEKFVKDQVKYQQELHKIKHLTIE